MKSDRAPSIRRLIVCAGMAFLAVAGDASRADEQTSPIRVKMATSLGDVVIELAAQQAPHTVLNFVEYVQAGFYDGTIFHRVIDGVLIQGGAFAPTLKRKTGGVREPVKFEGHAGLSNVDGTIAMVRQLSPDSATTEFFINLGNNAAFDDSPINKRGYAVFGRVAEGMDVIRRIARTPVGADERYAAGLLSVVPKKPVVIKSARLMDSTDLARAKLFVERHERALADAAREAELEEGRALGGYVAKAEKEAGAKFVTTDSGLRVLDIRVGAGPVPTIDDRVIIQYRALLSDGTVFEDSYADPEPRTFDVKRVVRGWQEALTTMRVGGKRAIIVPPKLGYGSRGVPGRIPPDATVIYEFDLLDLSLAPPGGEPPGHRGGPGGEG